MGMERLIPTQRPRKVLGDMVSWLGREEESESATEYWEGARSVTARTQAHKDVRASAPEHAPVPSPLLLGQVNGCTFFISTDAGSRTPRPALLLGAADYGQPRTKASGAQRAGAGAAGPEPRQVTLPPSPLPRKAAEPRLRRRAGSGAGPGAGRRERAARQSCSRTHGSGSAGVKLCCRAHPVPATGRRLAGHPGAAARGSLRAGRREELAPRRVPRGPGAGEALSGRGSDNGSLWSAGEVGVG